MFTTIITDCKSQNAIGRQETRFNSLNLGPTTTVGVSSALNFDATIEAAGNLIDVLDACNGSRGVVVANVAPRGDKSDGKNGTKFCYFFYPPSQKTEDVNPRMNAKRLLLRRDFAPDEARGEETVEVNPRELRKNTLVISTTKGYTLSLVKKFRLVKEVNLLDLEEVLEFAQNKKLIAGSLVKQIANSQFRSFDFVPRVAKWIFDGEKIPPTPYPLSSILDIPKCIWSIDAFGNCKTTLTANGLKLKADSEIETNIGIFKFYDRLKDVPCKETAIYIGSSGIGNKRFLEIATQGIPGSAAKSLNLKVGAMIKY